MHDLSIAKGHGLGNDYLILDVADLRRALGERDLRLPPAHALRPGAPAEPALLATLAKRICDRHFGLGSDGLLLADPSTDPVRLRIINPDGTEAEKSGNGLRIFGAWLHERGRVGRRPFPVELIRDTVEMTVLGVAADGARDIVVEMGKASFRGEDAGFAPEAGEALGWDLDLGEGLRAEVNPLSLSNPHCVVFVDALERGDFLARAPRICTHPEAFPAGTNVQFARVVGPARVEAWIWERGAGETLASGSSASAVASAALRRGLIDAREVTVAMPGGEVEIRISEAWDVRLRGPAQPVYRAAVPGAVVEGWLG